MKSLKPILICSAIILVVVLALLVFIFLLPNNTPVVEDTESESPIISTSGDTIYIIDKNYEELQTIEFLPNNGEDVPFTVEVTQASDGTYSFEVTPAAKYFTYDTSLLRSLLYTVSRVSAKGEITENVQELSAYGLDDPWYTVRCTYLDGAVTELYLGNQTVVDKNYYCKTNLSDQIYIIGSYGAQLLTRNELQYRDAKLFTTYEGEQIYENIDWVRLTKRDGTVLELERDFDEPDEDNIIGSIYMMRSPYAGSVNDELTKSSILDIIAPIAKIEIVCDITEDQFAEYGFDRPAKLEMTDVAGDSLSLLVGNTCENELYTYAMIEGTYTVLIIESACVTWTEIIPMELFVRVSWLYDISSIAQYDLHFNLDRLSSLYDGLLSDYTISMEHGTRINSSGAEVNTVDATINGEALDETNCRRLYLRMLNMRLIDYVPEGADLSAEPDAVFTLTMLDGTTSTMELIPYNDRDYAMVIDGKVEFFVYQKNINNIIDGLRQNDLGYEIDTSYSAY